jgi:hypothetical protein
VILLVAHKNQWRKVLKKVLSSIAIAALVFSFATTAGAANTITKKQGATTTSGGAYQPKKATYGSGMRANGSAACKMSGSC